MINNWNSETVRRPHTIGVRQIYIYFKRYIVARKEREDRQEGVLVLVKDNLNFQKLLVDDGPFRQYVMKKDSVRNTVPCY